MQAGNYRIEMDTSSESIPPGWGDDDLTQFMDLAHENARATFHNLKRDYRGLAGIDAAFMRLIEGWVDPENPYAAPLAVRSFSAYRAAVQLAMSTQLTESYMVMRGCLEHALYVNFIDATPGSWEVWRKWGESDDDKKRCVKMFSGRNIFDAIRTRDPVLGERAGALYERMIDFGAHPNELSVGSTMELSDRDDGGLSFGYSFMAGDGVPFRHCHKTEAQTGLIVLDTLTLVFPQRAAMTGVQSMIAPIKPFY